VVLTADCTEGYEFHRCNPVYCKLFQARYAPTENVIVMPKHIGVK